MLKGEKRNRYVLESDRDVTDPLIAAIERERRITGLSIPTFCKAAGVSSRTYYAYLDGTHKAGIENIRRLAEAIGCKVVLAPKGGDA